MTEHTEDCGCEAWVCAQRMGTDSEGYGSLIYYSCGAFLIGGDGIPAVRFCPWCGEKIGDA